MGVDVETMDALSVVTDKKVGDLHGARVWLLTGRGTPRTFLLRSCFIVDRIESPSSDGFKTKLLGEFGKIFDPMIELNAEEWFEDFKRCQGNFAFGLQRIKEERFIRGLEAVASMSERV